MANFINLLATLVASSQVVLSSTEANYFENFSKNLQSLDNKVAEPLGFMPGAKEVSNIIPGNEKEGKGYARLAGATYCENDKLVNWECTHCNKVSDRIESIEVFENEKTETKGYLAVNKDREEVIVAFRGSSNAENWLLNSKTKLTQIEINGKNYYVHTGFKEIIDNILPQISQKIDVLLRTYPRYKLLVTGHSLGGAIATLASLKLKYEIGLNDNRIKLYTYGAPRVGDPEFARLLNKHRFVSGRFVNENDVVPHLPAETKGYNHHHREFWVNGMSTQICSANELEDHNCSYKEWYHTSSAAHRIIWDIKLGNDSC
ncbi:alpha/beta-hydrolase [Neoconidiobolus thromboides FSU 785]|nr:alpha/beta-hydrolase [Neoconidiobolus thromboides FSU 785]